jgi:ketosteroid isomerase-like protein
MKSGLATLALGAALMLGAVGCDLGNPTATPIAKPTGTAVLATATHGAGATSTAAPTQAPVEPTGTPVTSAATPTEAAQTGVTPSPRQLVAFARYEVPPVSAKPSLKPYKVEAGLKNVSNASDFQLSAAARALVEQNGFVAQFPKEAQYKQFYQLYEEGRYAEKPVFVTTDSVLHVYHLIFDKLLRSTETKYLITDLNALTDAMLETTQAQYDALKGTTAENAARRNLAYFAVAQRLLDPTSTIPSDVQAEVNQELQLIEAHNGKDASPVMNMGGEKFRSNFGPGPTSAEYSEDYGQYKPRGHYTRSEDLKKYFKAMMWYGRMTFRLKSVDETRSALLMTEAMQQAGGQKGKADTLWALIYEPTAFFVGGADDLTYRDYVPLATQALGSSADPKVVADDARVAKFQEMAKSLAGPRINSMFVYITEDKEAVTKGLRFMGQRFTLDEYLFGQLIWRNVGTSAEPRLLPKGLDVPAAFGSQEAYKILDQMGETKYVSYTLQMDKMRGQVSGLAESQWTENLYWTWLYTFRPLIEPKTQNSGYPSFMTNDAWTRKNLNTVLGSWTELKHDTLLYAKQVMAEMGGGPPDLPKGYVEPEPEFYARVAALVAMTRDGLVSRGLLEKPSDNTSPSGNLYNTLNDMHDMVTDLKTISEKELAGQTLTDDEYTLIQYYGGKLEHITIDASDAADAAEFAGDLNDQDAAVVADVASEPGGNVLTEGTGRIMEIYVVAPVEGKLVMARGGIYSQYEFLVGTGDRLTDEQWRERLNNNQAPALGDWKTFVAK